MSHWLDDAARGLADGTHRRREVLRRGGAVAAGAVISSVTGPLTAVTGSARIPKSCLLVPCTPP